MSVACLHSRSARINPEHSITGLEYSDDVVPFVDTFNEMHWTMWQEMVRAVRRKEEYGYNLDNKDFFYGENSFMKKFVKTG